MRLEQQSSLSRSGSQSGNRSGRVVATKLGFAVVSELAGFEAASEEPQHQQQQHVL
jgi:hypothetical protein